MTTVEGASQLFFWKRSGQTQMIEDASPRNVIIPEFDYYTGTRLVSIAGRKKADSITDVLTALYQQFILENIKMLNNPATDYEVDTCWNRLCNEQIQWYTD